MAQHPIPGKYKRRMQRRIAYVFIAMFGMYFVVFLPDPILETIKSLAGGWAAIVSVLCRGAVGLPIAFLAQWIVFTQDSLATGRGEHSRFFRSQFPDSLIMNRFKCEKQTATALWFRWFNRWENGPEEYQSYHRMTFERSYGCRFIYHFRQWLAYFVILGGATFATTAILKVPVPSVPIGVACVLCAALGYTFLGFANQLPTSAREATGCWRKFQEISDIQRELLKQEIFARVTTYEQAWNFVGNWPTRVSAEHGQLREGVVCIGASGVTADGIP